MVCPNCSSFKVRKSGFTSTGFQRYTCKLCNYRHTCKTKKKKFDHYFIVKAFQLYLEGLNFVTIAEVLDLDRNVISKWLQPYVEIVKPIRLVKTGLKGELRRNSNAITFINPNYHSSGIIIRGRDSEVWGVKRNGE